MPKPVWSLAAGRCVHRNGIPVFTLGRVTRRTDGSGLDYTVSPATIDEYAHAVVEALNQFEGDSERDDAMRSDMGDGTDPLPVQNQKGYHD